MKAQRIHTWTPERIRSMRTRLGMSQYDLADRIGIRAATVNRYENGHAKPLRIIERALDDIEAAELAKVPG